MPEAQVVLITGCSSGIGRATAELLAQRNHIVYATARRPESIEELKTLAQSHPNNLRPLLLDVTNHYSIKQAVQSVLDEQHRIDVLINNAGYGQMGAVEDLPLDLWRAQFETNLFGLIAVTQTVLPNMRQHRAGRIINVSSVVAHTTLPILGAYSASKHALDAVSKALRLEVRPFGIKVIQIEPGPIATQFSSSASASVTKDSFKTAGPYSPLYSRMQDRHSGVLGFGAGTAEAVARKLLHAVESARPRMRYRITPAARLVPKILPFIPDRLLDAIFARICNLNRLK